MLVSSDPVAPAMNGKRPEVEARGRRRPSAVLGFDKRSGLYLWALLIITFGVWKPHLFLTQGTLHSVASEQAIIAIMALAVLFPLACGTFDLSIGATTNLAAVVVTLLQTNDHVGMWVAIPVTVVISALIGVVNGFVVVKLRISSFIATLASASIVMAVQTMVSGANQPNPVNSGPWADLTQRTVGGFQIVVLYLIVLAFLIWWVLEHTPVGRYLFAVGGNTEAARLSGVRTGKWVWCSLIAASTLCGIAGILYASLIGPSLTFGSSFLLPVYAACFLGSTQLRPGRFNVWGTLIAVYVLATGVEGLQLVTGVQWLSDMFNGVALIVAVSFAVWQQRKTSEVRRRRPAQLQRDSRSFDSAATSSDSRTWS